MTRPLRRSATAIAGLACALIAAGCTEDRPTTDDGVAWPSTDSPVATEGLVWAAGSTVHLADGSTIELEQEAGTYVVAGPGVFYFNAATTGPRFLLARSDGEVVETDADPTSLQTSADGRWLGLIDQPEGDNRPREVVVVDLTTGEEVVRSQEGVGAVEVEDPDDMDWEDLYEDEPVEMVGIVDDMAYVAGLSDYYAWDLTTGEAEVVDEPVHPADDPPYWNPSRTWQVPPQDVGAVPVLRPADDGEAVTTFFPEPDRSATPALPGDPDLESWTLMGWLDDETAVGLTSTTDPYDPLPVLVTCAVPSGECGVLEGAEEGVSLPVDRPSGLPPMYP